MRTFPLALAAAFLASAAHSATLIDGANGVQSDASGTIVPFNGLLIGDDGKVVRVLRAGDARPAAERVIDLGGKTVLPGLIDAHGHILSLGFAAIQLDLSGTKSLAELQQRLRDYAAANPNEKWILGLGWNHESWGEKRFPTAADLDAVVSDRPVWLERVDGHAAIANSAALKLAGITPKTKPPAGGEIHDGLFVDNAQELIEKVIPEPSPAMRDKALSQAQQAMLRVGLVGVADMGTSAADWAALRRAGEAGSLKVRVFSYSSGPEGWRSINAGRPTGWMYGDRLRLLGAKLYADGALGSRGAWLKLPYRDRPDTRGLQFLSNSELLSQTREVAGGGGQIATHAIGDAAIAQVISTYQALAKEFGRDRRWRIEHFQIADPLDIPRLKSAGIIASMQPTHQTSDRLMAEARLGPDRLAGAYAWNSLVKLGIPLAFGSDFPVESPNPFPGLAAAISRQDMGGQPPGGWLPHERVTLGQAIHGFTRGAAYAGFADDRIGALEPGKWADFIIVDRDPTKADAQALARTRVLETWIAGKQAWKAEPSPPSPERGK